MVVSWIQCAPSCLKTFLNSPSSLQEKTVWCLCFVFFFSHPQIIPHRGQRCTRSVHGVPPGRGIAQVAEAARDRRV